MEEELELFLETIVNKLGYMTPNYIKNIDQRKTIMKYIKNKLKKTSKEEQACMKIIIDNPNSYIFAPEIIKENKDFALLLVMDSYKNIEQLPKKLIEDREFIIDLITIAGIPDIIIPGLFNNIPRKYYKDEELVLMALEIEPSILKYIDNDFRYNIKFIKELLKKDIQYLTYIPVEIENIKEIVLNEIKENKRAIFYIPEELLYDEDFVVEALKINEYLLSIISTKFEEKTFYKICLKAGIEIKIPNHLVEDKEFILECIWINKDVFYNNFGMENYFNDNMFVEECECLGCSTEEYNKETEKILKYLREEAIISGEDEGYTI